MRSNYLPRGGCIERNSVENKISKGSITFRIFPTTKRELPLSNPVRFPFFKASRTRASEHLAICRLHRTVPPFLNLSTLATINSSSALRKLSDISREGSISPPAPEARGFFHRDRRSYSAWSLKNRSPRSIHCVARLANPPPPPPRAPAPRSLGSVARSRKLRGHRPTVLFFHPVPRGARARDYQTAGVRDCCTRQMLPRRPNLLPPRPLPPMSTVLFLPRPATLCRSLPSSPALAPSSRGATVLVGQGTRKFATASCHAVPSGLCLCLVGPAAAKESFRSLSPLPADADSPPRILSDDRLCAFFIFRGSSGFLGDYGVHGC